MKSISGNDGLITATTALVPQAQIRTRRWSTDSMKHVKVAILGQQGVGKSAISVRFLTRRFIGEYDTTLETRNFHQMMIDGDIINFEVYDTCATGPFEYAKDEHIKWGDAFLFVYDITNRNSYKKLRDLRKHILNIRKSTSVPLLVVGNKADVDFLRKVTYEEGSEMARQFGCPFVEVSAAEDCDKIQLIFTLLYKEAKAARKTSRTLLDRLFGGKK